MADSPDEGVHVHYISQLNHIVEFNSWLSSGPFSFEYKLTPRNDISQGLQYLYANIDGMDLFENQSFDSEFTYFNAGP